MTVDGRLREDQSAEGAAALRMLRRTAKQWPVVLICALVAGGTAYFASDSRTRMYSSTTMIQLNEVDLGAVLLEQNLQQLGQDAQAKMATSARLITLPRVLEAASNKLGGRISPADVGLAIAVTPQPGTTLVEIAARNPDPALAAAIADATRKSFIDTRRAAAVAQLDTAKGDVNRQLSAMSKRQRNSPDGQSLRDRVQQIDTLRAVSNGGVDTVQTARVSGTAISPNPRRDAILGLLAGALGGLVIAVFRATLDGRVRDASELSELWDLPILGLIPETADLKDDAKHELPSAAALEAFSFARTNLRYLDDVGEIKVVVVTSALAGEGKSTVVWNLALAAAMAQSNVLVIEADLRRPSLARRIDANAAQGLSEVLAGIATFDSAVLHASYAQAQGGPIATIDVLLAGMIPPSPMALLERPGTAALLKQAAAQYDLVLIDTPPATIIADAKVLAHHADGVIVVSRLGHVRRAAFGRLRAILGQDGPPVLGMIVNGGASAKAYDYVAEGSSRDGHLTTAVTTTRPVAGRATS